MAKATDKFKTIICEGDLVIDNVTQYKEDLLKAFENNKKIIIKFKNVEKMDLTFIQLILSANLYAIKNKKELGFSGELSDELIKAFYLSGILANIPEKAEDIAACFVNEIKWNS